MSKPISMAPWRDRAKTWNRFFGRSQGALVAFCVGIVHNARLYTLKTSYDERYAYFAPGNVLRLAMIERCFQEEIVSQELLGPMLRWKERFATGSRDTSVLRAYRRRPGPVLRYGGRRVVLPWLRAAYLRSRRAGDRLRGRRGAAPGRETAPGASAVVHMAAAAAGALAVREHAANEQAPGIGTEPEVRCNLRRSLVLG